MGKKDPEWIERAEQFKRRLTATGLGPAEFAREAGLSRSVIYHLSTGQAPSNAEQKAKLETTFERLRRA